MSESTNPMPFGERLKGVLDDSVPPRTQAWLADEAGIERSMVTRIIKGERNASPESIFCMAKVLGLDVGMLVRGTDAEARVDASRLVVQRTAYDDAVKAIATYEARLRDTEDKLRAATESLAAEADRRRLADLQVGQAHLDLDRAKSDLAEARDANRRLQCELRSHREAFDRLAAELAATATATRTTQVLAGIAAATGVVAAATLLFRRDEPAGEDGSDDDDSDGRSCQ